MRRIGTILCALSIGGCSIVLAPDRDAIVPSMDAGIEDGGYDASDTMMDAGDAGWDAGDGGPERCEDHADYERSEVTCNDGLDNDCDGNPDCDDADCAGDGYCCSFDTRSPWPGDALTYEVWTPHGILTATSTGVEFGTAIGQVVHPDCAPLAFGMRFTVVFDYAGGDPTDFASLVLSPVDRPRVGGDRTLLADLTLRVSGDGHAQLERGGVILGETPTAMPLSLGQNEARVDLTPTVDELGRPVLLVSAEIEGRELANDQILMPLSDLVGTESGCAPDGLHLAFEGKGDAVLVGATETRIGGCDSPTQFLSDAAGPLGEPEAYPTGTGPGEWCAGGMGDPALSFTGAPTDRAHLLLDCSEDERSDEIFRFLDFAIGGSVRSSAWVQRTDGAAGPPQLFGASPSSREPAFAVGGELNPHFVAFAEATGSGDAYELRYASLSWSAPSAAPAGERLLSITDSGECDSLRDPAVIATAGPSELVVLFTCQRNGRPDTIGAARLHQDVVMGYVVDMVDASLLTPAVGSYARQGVLSPEVVLIGMETPMRLRVWFLARDAGGRVSVGLALGELDATSGLPRLEPYPGNPILEAEDQVLGGPCPGGCAIDSLAVAPSEGMASAFWPMGLGREDSYIFLVARSRFRTDGVDHQLVPIRQPRPSDG